MKNNFWSKINQTNNKPYLLLAPVAGYTDQPFRLMCKKYGVDVTYSEMVSSEAIWHNRNKDQGLRIKLGLLKTLKLIQFSEAEKPYVVQIFGANPKHMAFAARYIASGEWFEDYIKISNSQCLISNKNPKIINLNKLKIDNCKLKIESIPDGIDVNMGCPVRDVIKSGAGVALMRNTKLACKIVKEIKKKVKNIPVSVKTRLGWERHDEILDFAIKIEDAGADAIAIHGRTRKEGFSGPVDWETIGKVKKKLRIPVIGNGGIDNNFQLTTNNKQLDGLMIGTGAIGHPWIFEKIKNQKSKIKNNVSLRDDYKDIEYIKQNILEHAELYRDLKGDSFIEFRKQLVWYFTGLPGASEARKMAVKVEKYEDMVKICEKI